MKSYKKEVLSYCLNDEDFQNIYFKKYNTLKGFKERLTSHINYCFCGYYFNPFLDKPYLDVCWLKIEGLKKYINLDDIFTSFECDISEG